MRVLLNGNAPTLCVCGVKLMFNIGEQDDPLARVRKEETEGRKAPKANPDRRETMPSSARCLQVVPFFVDSK
jgi:hypothetical protein